MSDNFEKTNASACCVWDFTIHDEELSAQEVRGWLLDIAKKWCYQRERGEESGKLHFQGRLSLKTKVRHPGLIDNPFKAHFSRTSNENRDNNFYVSKKETRVEGPWKDDDKVTIIPRQVRDIVLYEWQQEIVDRLKIWDTRIINVVIDRDGNKGKSTLLSYIRAHGLGRVLPSVNDSKDMMRMVCDLETAGAYLFDMPKAMSKDKLYGFYSAIEQIKDGYAYDDRYHFKEKVFDCPQIWIFTNKEPDESLLSRDRWVYWRIIANKLVNDADCL